MELKRRELPGAIGISHLPTDCFKTDFVSVSFLMPLTRENTVRASLVRSILSRGCEGYPSLDRISARLAELYGADLASGVRAYGDTLILSFTVEMLADRFSEDGTEIRAGVWDLLRRLLFFPVTENGTFRPDYTESEKQRLSDEIAAKINHKRSYAIRRLGEELFRGTPAALPELGYAEDIPALDAGELFGFWRWLVTACPVEVGFLGSFTPEQTEVLTAALFAGLERRAEPFSPSAPRLLSPRGEERRVFETMDGLRQGQLVLGLRSPCALSADRDFAAVMLANELYGGGSTSKLFLHVREELNLCYDCRSALRSERGAMIVYAGIDGKSLAPAYRAIREMLEQTGAGNFSAEELMMAKKSLCSACLSLSDSPHSLSFFALSRRLCGVSDTPRALSDRIASLTAEEVAAAARRLTPDTLYFLSGDKKAEEALK